MTHPYKGLGEEAFWRSGMAERDASQPDRLWTPKFPIGPDTAVVTAGSSFAERFGACLAAASVLFGVMMFADACLPHDMAMRLSIEDLAKTWATFFFFLFAWCTLRQCIERIQIPVAEESEVSPAHVPLRT